MRNYIWCFLFFALFSFHAASVNKIKVSIYYESMSRDSIRFIVTQLSPSYIKLGDYMDLDFVPYGKAIHMLVNGEWIFECLNGETECYVNKVQACALNQNLTQSDNLNFISCIMSSFDPASDYRINKCAENYGFSYNNIKECALNGLGDALLAHYGDRTHAVRPKIQITPTVIFNDEYDDNVQSGSKTNFIETFCKALDKTPDVCKFVDSVIKISQ